MKEKDFNLLHEPWILVLNENGNQEEVSLIEVFRYAHKFKMLSGELPTQDIAILRLLLAVLYAVFLRKDVKGVPAKIEEEEDAFERWSSLWNLGHFPSEVIENYLTGYEERFYLIHPDRPFYQINFGMEFLTKKKSKYEVSKLIGDVSESGNKDALFSPRSGKNKEQVSLAEATRWLIHVNAFDDSSGKPTVRDGTMPPTGVGWLAKLGLIYASGKTLFETLMLNFVTWGQNNQPFPIGNATWELIGPRSGEREVINVPDEPLGLLTLQSRRLRLLYDETKIIGYKLLGGDVFSEKDAFIEQMTLWKKDSKKGFVPKLHDPARALWRDFSSLLPQTEKDENISGVVKWMIKLNFNGLLPERQINFQSIGIQYDTKKSSIDNVFSDGVAVNVHLLGKKGLNQYVPRIIKTINITEDCVKKYGKFATDLAKASGRDDKKFKEISETAREEAFFKLDMPFRKWLAGIDPNDDKIEHKFTEWTNVMKKILSDCGKKMMAEAGDKTLVGKSMKENAFSAFWKFSSVVKKLIEGV